MPSPSAEQLAYVVTHGELLSLLSLQRLEAMLDASPAPPPPTADELAAAEAAVRAELQRQERLWLEQPADGAPADADASIVVMPAAQPSAHNAAAVDIGPQIEAALAEAYADIPGRAQALQGVDTASLVPALAALAAQAPALPALTGPLDVPGVSAWLDLHDAGDPALDALMAQALALTVAQG
jgi:hypothetical protein